MMKQQESGPFTTAEKSFEKNYILHGYRITFVLTMKSQFVKIYHFSFIYICADIVIGYVSSIVIQGN